MDRDRQLRAANDPGQQNRLHQGTCTVIYTDHDGNFSGYPGTCCEANGARSRTRATAGGKYWPSWCGDHTLKGVTVISPVALAVVFADHGQDNKYCRRIVREAGQDGVRQNLEVLITFTLVQSHPPHLEPYSPHQCHLMSSLVYLVILCLQPRQLCCISLCLRPPLTNWLKRAHGRPSQDSE